MSWRVDLYVSGRADGTLDPSIDTIKSAADQSISDTSRYVGSLLYTKADIDNYTTYIQATNSTFSRGKTLSQTTMNNAGASIYNFPYVEWLKPGKKTYGSGNNTVYIVREAAPNSLPMNIDSIGSNYRLVQDIVSTNEFTSAIIRKLSSQMGVNFFVKLGTSIYTDIIKTYTDKFKVSYDTSVFEPLYPTNENSPVEWCCVVYPMMQFNANSSSVSSMWFINDSNYMDKSMDIFNSDSQEIPTIATPNGKDHVTLILDAYGTAQYNYVTKASSGMGIYNLPGLHQAMKDANVNIPDDLMIAYQTYGLLSKEYGSLYKNVATASVVDETINPYFSVPCSSTSTVWDDATMARQGGIGIYVTKKKDNSIPVYYYITPTPNDPVQTTPTTVPVDKPFTPNPPAGTKVKKVIYPTDNSLVVPNNPPQNFPDPLPGNPPYTEITPTDGTYPIDPDNPPSHILVECVQTDIPIYYHVFTFTNTTGNDYKDVFEYLKDNPSVRESAAVENITAVGTTPILADGTKSTYTPQSSSSGTIVAALSTSGTNLGNSWGWLTQQGSTQCYKRMCSYKAFQACIILL